MNFAIAILPGERFGVDLRELHEALESKRQFGNWVDEKLAQFIEGQDFEVFNNSVKNPTGGRPRIDYAVSVECAKHIAMMEQTDRGRAVRQYFIVCEAELHARAALPPATYPAAILAAKMATFAISAPGDVETFEAMAALHKRLTGSAPRLAPTVVKPPRPEPKLSPAKILALIPDGGIRVERLRRLACECHEASRSLFYREWRKVLGAQSICRDDDGRVFLPDRSAEAG